MFGLGVLSAWCFISLVCMICDASPKGSIKMKPSFATTIILMPAAIFYSAAVIILGAISFFFKGIDKRFKKWYNNHKKNKRKR